MLGVVQRRVLSMMQGALVLHSLYGAYRDRALQLRADTLLQHHRSEILKDLESMLNPAVCIVAERGCNFRLFDGVLQHHKTGLLVSRKGKLVLDDELTESYMAGRDLPRSYKYFILSPYVVLDRFCNREYFITEYKVSDRVKGGIRRTLLDLIRFLDQSGCNLYERDGVYFKRTETRSFIHIRAHFDAVGSYEQTRYKYRSLIMENVESLGRELKQVKKGRDLSSFMTEVTRRLLGQLTSLGVFRDEFDLEMFPDLVPVLFPFRMVSGECKRLDCTQLVTVGFDLRGAAASHLGFLFDAERIDSVVRMGGVYMCTVTV